MSSPTHNLVSRLADDLTETTTSFHLGLAWLAGPKRGDVAVSLLDKALQSDARDIAKRTIRKLTGRGDQTFELGGDLARDQFGVLTLDAAQESGLLHGEIKVVLERLVNFTTAPGISPIALGEDLPAFFAILAAANDGTTILGRRFSRANVARHGFMRVIVGSEATLKRFDEELIIFDNEVDWIFVENLFIVLRPELFEAALSDPERLDQKTQDNARAIHTKVPIANFDEFEDRCRKVPAMQSRLARIVASEEWQAWRPDVTKLKEYSARYGNAVDWSPDDEMLFDGQPRRQWNILKLLDQAFYTGELTQTPYEATGKIRMGS